MSVRERTEDTWPPSDELELHTAGWPLRASWNDDAVILRLWTATHTAPPVKGLAIEVGRLLIEVASTGSMRLLRPEYREIMLTEPYTETPDPLEIELLGEESEEPGSPSTSVLLRAVADLRAAMSLTQKQLATYIGLSPSTVMGWKRNRSLHPRHPQIPILLRLWSAVAGAQEELGSNEALRLIYASAHQPLGGGPDAGALAEILIAAAEAASLAAFKDDDGYESTTATALTRVELEAEERELHTALNQYLDGPGASALE